MIPQFKKILVFSVAIIAVLLVWGLFIWPATHKPKIRINKGSCLLACSNAIKSLREYAQEGGKFPYEVNDDRKALSKAGVPEEYTVLLDYANQPNLNMRTASRMILIICVNSTSLPTGEAARYVALGSGDVLIVPEKYAILGKECPSEVGVPMQ